VAVCDSSRMAQPIVQHDVSTRRRALTERVILSFGRRYHTRCMYVCMYACGGKERIFPRGFGHACDRTRSTELQFFDGAPRQSVRQSTGIHTFRRQHVPGNDGVELAQFNGSASQWVVRASTSRRDHGPRTQWKPEDFTAPRFCTRRAPFPFRYERVQYWLIHVCTPTRLLVESPVGLWGEFPRGCLGQSSWHPRYRPKFI